MTFDSSNAVDIVPLVIHDDEADENAETMSASLSFPGLPLERVFLEPNTTVVEIHDNDCELVYPQHIQPSIINKINIRC